MKKNICVIEGDGIGPEITKEAIKVLDKVSSVFGHEFSYTKALMGGCAIDATGEPLPKETIDIAKSSDAVLQGSIGGDPKTSPWYQLPPEKRPEAGLLGIRKALGLYANLRPAHLYNELRDACPLNERVIGDGFDIMIVRELTGGLYFGRHDSGSMNGIRYAKDELKYDETEISRITRIAFESAMKRNKNLVSVDKANVLSSSRLWRDVVTEISKEYPEVNLSHMFVDNAAMQLVRRPGSFDVVLTENMFGDILSDEASEIAGSLGMLPSASLGEGSFGLYEPSGGSAPDIAGQGIANPLAAILSAAMMLTYSFDMTEEGAAIEKAVELTLKDGIRTADIRPRDDEGYKCIGTEEMGDEVAKRIKKG